jgi:hypothetical protein
VDAGEHLLAGVPAPRVTHLLSGGVSGPPDG